MNLGIIGTSDISTKSIIPYVKELEEIKITGVASRTSQAAKEFSNKYNIPYYYDSYQNLLKSSDIDSVYIALPPAMQGNTVLEALYYQKNVLVEKPICTEYSQILSIKKIAQKKQLFVCEGIMIKHHPWIDKLKNIIHNNKYGKILKCCTKLTMQIPQQMLEGYRINPKLGGGVFLDEAPYWLFILQNTIGLEMNEIELKHLSIKNKVDWELNIASKVDQIPVEFYCSYKDNYAANHIIYLENATISVKNFFRPSLGNYKMNITIDQQNNKKENISFEKQNYYFNQLVYFLKNVENQKVSQACINESEERVKLIEKIYNLIQNKNQGVL